MKPSIGLQNDVSDVIVIFTDYLFIETHYQIFEKPITKSLKDARLGGYRRPSTREGDYIGKKVNFLFQLTVPSRVEMEEYIKNWVKNNNVRSMPANKEEWVKLFFRYLDDFVTEYLIVEPFDTVTVTDILMGYRPTKERTKYSTRIILQAFLLNPSEDELRNVLKNWSDVFFG